MGLCSLKGSMVVNTTDRAVQIALATLIISPAALLLPLPGLVPAKQQHTARSTSAARAVPPVDAAHGLLHHGSGNIIVCPGGERPAPGTCSAGSVHELLGVSCGCALGVVN